MNKILRKNRRKNRTTYKVRKNNYQNLPILYVDKSSKHMRASVVHGSKTLITIFSKDQKMSCYNVKLAAKLGKKMNKKMINKKINEVVINTCGNKYHGKIAAFIKGALGEENV